MNLLFIGDVVGELGRQGIKALVPKLRKEHKLDLVVANIENLAHGKGITKKTFKEVSEAGIDVFTTGNHVWRREEGVELLEDGKVPIVRPANYPEGVPGRGYVIVDVNGKKVLVINLMGRVFMKQDLEDPFRTFDNIIHDVKDADEIVVDFHAEASSEKRAFGWYVIGRASLVVGTHTHIPTADEQILGDQSLGYVTDIGMVGAHESVLGVKKEEIIESFLTQLPVKHKMIKVGDIVFNSVLATLDDLKTIAIKRVDTVLI